MNEAKKDQELRMGREITRRDFLNGVAAGVGSSLSRWNVWSEDSTRSRCAG
jgi:hypothetical protein